jgi:hypothetical protein
MTVQEKEEEEEEVNKGKRGGQVWLSTFPDHALIILKETGRRPTQGPTDLRLLHTRKRLHAERPPVPAHFPCCETRLGGAYTFGRGVILTVI